MLSMSEENKIRDAADAVKGIVEAVPIYQDALQPAAKEVGKGLETIAKTIHIALAPVSALVWGFDQIKDFVSTRVAEKLKGVPQERIKSPSPSVAGPALEALKYTGYEDSLRNLYANLLANSMDSKTAADAHPAFVDIIKSMTPDEARLIKMFATSSSCALIDLKVTLKEGGFIILHRNVSLLGGQAGCEYSQLVPNYLDNLCRLGLLDIPIGFSFNDKNIYTALESSVLVQDVKQSFEGNDKLTFGIDHKKVDVTDFGKQFIRACVVDKPVDG